MSRRRRWLNRSGQAGWGKDGKGALSRRRVQGSRTGHDSCLT